MRFADGSYEILQALAPGKTSYLGIGVQEGVCVQHVAAVNPGIALTLCDTWGFEHGGTGRGSHQHVNDRLDACGHRGRRLFLDGASQALVPALPNTLEASFDLIYVDGSHEERAALDDLRNCWPRMWRDSVLVLHDVKMPPVMSALFRFLDEIDDVAPPELYGGGYGTAVVRRL